MSVRVPVAVRRADSQTRERGAIAVEFALVLPIVVVLLLGTVTAGVAYSHAIGLTNAVREGARFGAVTVSDSNWATSVVTRTRQTQFDDPGAVTEVCAILLKNATGSTAVPATPVWASACPPALASAAPTPPAVPNNKCVSVVWASRSYEIQTGLLPSYTGSMKPKSVALYERDCK